MMTADKGTDASDRVLFGPLEPLQTELLGIIWDEITGHGPAGVGGWRIWDHVEGLFLNAHPELESALSVFNSLPLISAPSIYSPIPYGLMWWSDHTSEPMRHEPVGLTIAGLTLLSVARPAISSVADELVGVIREFASTEARLRTDPKKASERVVDLPDFIGWLLVPTAQKAYSVSSDVVGQILRHEYDHPVDVYLLADEWKVRLGDRRLRKYRNVKDARDYLKTIADAEAIRAARVIADKIDSATEESPALLVALEMAGEAVAGNHYRQAVESYEARNLESSNAQLRSFLEALFVGLAKKHTTYKGAEASSALQALMGKDHLLDGEYNLLRGLWTLSQERGAHPGLTDADEARFRMSISTSATRFLLHRLMS